MSFVGTKLFHDTTAAAVNYQKYEFAAETETARSMLKDFIEPLEYSINEFCSYLNSIIEDVSDKDLADVDLDFSGSFPAQRDGIRRYISANKVEIDKFNNQARDDKAKQLKSFLLRNFLRDPSTQIPERSSLKELETKLGELSPVISKLSSKILASLAYSTYLNYAHSNYSELDEAVTSELTPNQIAFEAMPFIEADKRNITNAVLDYLKDEFPSDGVPAPFESQFLTIVAGIRDNKLKQEHIDFIFTRLKELMENGEEEDDKAIKHAYFFLLSNANNLKLDESKLDLLQSALRQADQKDQLSILISLANTDLPEENAFNKALVDTLVNYIVDIKSDDPISSQYDLSLAATQALANFASLSYESLDKLFDTYEPIYDGIQNTLIKAVFINSSQENKEYLSSKLVAKLEEAPWSFDYPFDYIQVLSELSTKLNDFTKVFNRSAELYQTDSNAIHLLTIASLALHDFSIRNDIEFQGDFGDQVREIAEDHLSQLNLSFNAAVESQDQSGIASAFDRYSFAPAMGTDALIEKAKREDDSEPKIFYPNLARRLVQAGPSMIPKFINSIKDLDPNENPKIISQAVRIMVDTLREPRELFFDFFARQNTGEDVNPGIVPFMANRIGQRHAEGHDAKDSFIKLYDFALETYKKFDDSQNSVMQRFVLEGNMAKLALKNLVYLESRLRQSDDVVEKAFVDGVLRQAKIVL